ncbi:MAG: MFS transporter [Clostridiales bacterium]|nr:MFS transporter [Clostridiales bacterium]
MEQKKYLTMKERISFTVGAFGRSGIYTLMSMYTLVFFQNGAGLSLSQGTTIILIGRIFDALNDPLMGMLVDRTKSKWGKMRPYLLFAPVPIAICTILLFTAPFAEGSTAAFVWALVTYILWGVSFTIQDVPFWGLSSVITPLESERTSFISTARLGSTFGGILPALLVPILYQSNLGYSRGFFVSAVIFALLGCGLSILIFFVSKERVPKVDSTPSFKETFAVLGKNKLLIIVIFASVLGSTMVTANQCADYIGNYLIIQNYTDFSQIFTDLLPGAQTTLVDNVDAAAAYDFWIPRGTIVTTLTVAIGVGMVPAMAIFPMLRKKLSLKQIYIGSAVFGLVVHALCYLVLQTDVTTISIYLLWVFLFLMGLPLGIFNVITYALIADAVDYLEWKTGERHEGVCFSFQTFLSKVQAAVATFVFGQLLDQTDFKAVDKSLVDVAGRQIFFEQSESTQKVLLALVTIVPAAGFLLAMIPMFFNDFTGKTKENAQKELEEKHEQMMLELESDAQAEKEQVEA